jgi:hypothetical protein
MNITPDCDTCPSSEANRGEALRSDAKDRTCAHCIKQVRYRIKSEGKTELATAETKFALQRIR